MVNVPSEIITAAPLLGEPLPIELMNTIWADPEGQYDALTTITDVTAWLDAVGGRDELADLTFGRSATAHDLASFRRLRDALRFLAARLTDDHRTVIPGDIRSRAEAIRAINQAAAGGASWPELTWSPATSFGTRTAASTSVSEVALSRIAQAGIRLIGSSDRAKLRPCDAPGCVLFFLRAHPRREWCSDSCGNRARVARHYQRHHQRPSWVSK